MRNQLAVLLVTTMALGGCTAVDEMTDDSPGRGSVGQPGYQVAAEPGETIEQLATRFDLPSSAVIEANHLRPPYTLRPHQALVIPPPATYRVHDGDSVEAISTMLGVDEVALARANGLQKPYHMRVNQILRVPGGYGDGTLARDAGPEVDPNLAYVPPGAAAITSRSAISSQTLAPPPGVSTGLGSTYTQAQPLPPQTALPPEPMAAPQPAPQAVASQPHYLAPPSQTALAPQQPIRPAPPPQAAPAPPPQAASNAPTAIYPVQQSATPAAAPSVAPAPAPVQQAMVAPAAVAAGGPHFIRPVSGQTLQGFGSDGSGQTNDGINIAAAAGTPVQAADAGTVIYTGNELAAFGNLVLIRHAGGWVTAYGHLATIGVQRGSTVTQGQSIGTVGQTGSATAPQLHFEIRQGSKPVDPAPFLSGKG